MDDFKELKEISIFAGIITGLFLILILFNFLTNGISEKHLRNQIQSVLDKSEPEKYLVEEAISLDSQLEYNIRAYNVNTNNNKKVVACLVKITGLCGPVSVVYTYSSDMGAVLEGVISLTKINVPSFQSGVSLSQSEYWKKIIEEIFQEAAS